MICPVVPPSAANAKVSGANWLDRLRSSKGFPPPEADPFLAPQTSASASDTLRPSTHPAVDESRGRRNGEVGVSDILCQLFVMGATNHACNRRKSSRKQLNPRFWDATGSSKKSSNGGSSDDLKLPNKNNPNFNTNGLASSGDYSLNQHRKERDCKDPGELGLDVEEEEAAVELKGYSKSEVTVIDSSIQGWKVEMFAFRKRKSKSVWRVQKKEGKSKGLMNARRKRKLLNPNSSHKDDGDGEERRQKKKKRTVRVSDSAPGSLFMNQNGEKDDVVPLIKERNTVYDEVYRTLERVGCPRGEAPVKSSLLPCSNTHWKSKREASSVILVKPISTCDKSGTRKPGKMPINKDQ